MVAKNEVQEGQIIVYCEIDSLLPGDAEWLPPAVKTRVEQSSKQDWFRVKTVRIRKALSQGLIVPTLPPNEEKGWKIGDDVTRVLGIKKYEPVAFSGKLALQQTSSGIPFPSHLLRKTEELRVQSNLDLFAAIRGQPYYATVKLDGTSGTFLVDPSSGEFWCCSRNQIRPRPENLDVCPYWRAASNAGLEAKLLAHPGYALQGEVCGPGIQKNPLKLKDIQLFVFNVVDLRSGGGVPLDKFLEVCAELGVKTVPIEEMGDSFDYEAIGDVLERARGKYASGKTREGLVFRTKNQAISFKAINNDYL